MVAVSLFFEIRLEILREDIDICLVFTFELSNR